MQLVLGAFLLLTICAAAQQRRFDGRTLWHHVEILAADDMEGRRTGSAGLERAQAYVVDQLKKIGLTPAGLNGYVQPAKLLTRQVIDKDSTALRPGVRVTTRILTEPLDSANLVAKLEGSDPTLRNEYVVLTAHLDHLRIRPASPPPASRA